MSTTTTTPFVRVDGSVPAGLEPSHRDARRAPGQPPEGDGLAAVARIDAEMQPRTPRELEIVTFHVALERARWWEYERTMRARQAYAASVSQMLAKQPSFAAVCEARGEHERAAAQREILRQRGISLEEVIS